MAWPSRRSSLATRACVECVFPYWLPGRGRGDAHAARAALTHSQRSWHHTLREGYPGGPRTADGERRAHGAVAQGHTRDTRNVSSESDCADS